MASIENQRTENIIKQILNGQHYRPIVDSAKDLEFLEIIDNFFKQLARRKMRGQPLTEEWYQEIFPFDDIAFHGENLSTTSQVQIIHTPLVSKNPILDSLKTYYDNLPPIFEISIGRGNDVETEITIKLQSISIHLDLSEFSTITRILAAKRKRLNDEITNQIERYLMLTLCKLFKVGEKNYRLAGKTEQRREIDFVLIDTYANEYPCEIKLMGRGNPESADVIIARGTKIFIAETLLDLHRQQLTHLGVDWVALRSPNRLERFQDILDRRGIPFEPFTGDLDQRLTEIFSVLFPA